jgi:ABC-2 type transport system permease protein
MPAAPVVITTYGDPTNANYLMAVVWNDMITYEHVLTAADIQIPVRIEAQSLHSSQALSEFDRYVPGLLILAAMMLMFTAAAALVREKDKGTLVRLRLSRMTTFEWLSAVSLTQLILGLAAIALTYLTAAALGYEASGSLLAGAFVSALASLAIIGISILVAAYLRTIFDLLTVGCFPFFILMFFSGGMFPLPPVRVMSVGTRAIQLNEILPTTHAINALGKILNSGANLSDLGYELLAMGILTVVYFTLGVWIFTRRHMRA